MSGQFDGLRVAFLERPHPPDHRGALVERLVPLLRSLGARVEVVHAETSLSRLDIRPPWDLVVLKSGSAAALHVAAAAEAWGIPSINTSAATRLAQDKLASSLMLQQAGVPIAPSRLAWLAPRAVPAGLRPLADRPLVVKASRGSQGQGLWTVGAGELAERLADIPPGPYLVMDHVPHSGDDLKVFVAGQWMDAILRPFPATTLTQKLGRATTLPPDVADVVPRIADVLGLSCFGCDFVKTAGGWMLVDVNAFPGYKGPPDAARAIADEIARSATLGQVVG